VLLRAAAGTAVVLLATGLVGALAAGGNPFGSEPQLVQGPTRLTEGSLNNRWDWWKEAWEGFEGQPVAGTGAGSFELVHRQLRNDDVDVREVHNLPLQFASELGLVGFLLAVGFFGAALLGAWRALGRLDGDERAAAAALAVALPTFLVHGALDYDWDFVAVCGPLFFITGVLLATGRAPLLLKREYAWVAVVVLVAWAGLYSIAAPRVGGGGSRLRGERALARSALDRPASRLGRRDGGGPADPPSPRALRRGCRPPAAELGSLV
jgi:hypothetical protein